MIRRLRDWIDDRTGLGKVIDVMLLEHIPGGAKWRYVWGSALMFVFSVQLITGVLLMTAYSPGDTTAWSSVYFIQYKMDFGWLIRGLHHFGSQTMVVLMGVHMLQVVIAGAHLKPREVNWWLGLGLLGVVLGLSLTGYLLPWDQKGYYATQVATNIAGKVPLVGPFMQKVVVGGPEYGNHTLTRFFSLHVAILPGLAIALVVAHIWVFRRHGVTHPKNTKGKAGWFWPDQAFRDMVVSMIVFAVMLGLVLYGWGNKVEPTPDADGNVPVKTMYDKVAHAGNAGLGANLDAPADPDSPYPARPEWYFLFLFQILKYFQGDLFLVGTLVIPGAIGLLLFVLPLLGYGKLRMTARVFSVLVVVALLGGVAYLTAQAWAEDQRESNLAKPPYSWAKLAAGNRYDADKAEHFQTEMDAAELKAKRAIQLAGDGIPAAGPRLLLRNDPMTKGKTLFKVKCASCHNYHDATAVKDDDKWMNKKPTASDLTDFGSEEWTKRLLNNPAHEGVFGKTSLTTMSEWVKDHLNLPITPEEEATLSADDKADLAKARADVDVLAKWLGSHPRATSKQKAEEWFAEGERLFGTKGRDCIGCHSYEGSGGGKAARGPDLTGYGDEQWLRAMIMDPAGPTRYGKKNRMPVFRDLDAPGAELLKEQAQRERTQAVAAALGGAVDADKVKFEAMRKQAEQAYDLAHKLENLSDLDRELIVRWMMKDPRVVFGGEPIGGAAKKK